MAAAASPVAEQRAAERQQHFGRRLECRFHRGLLPFEIADPRLGLRRTAASARPASGSDVLVRRLDLVVALPLDLEAVRPLGPVQRFEGLEAVAGRPWRPSRSGAS